MFSPPPARRRLLLASLLLVGLTLAGCATGAGGPGGQGSFRSRFATPTAPPAAASPRATVANISPRAVVRTFTDANGRTITLYHGRAVGRQGDWGWAHIVGKHLKGEWHDGGPITRFDVVGVTTPEGVQDLINRTLLQDSQPDAVGSGRREYRLPLSAQYESLVVVGGDGAIITAYPAPPRRPRP